MDKVKRHFILGTAGHIDHGKTALVQALTGVDTDRLKEEKARGLTIDIGFAHFGDDATIIDVPGHEKFIKNMVAGVSTIDLVLFVVAADDGVMPQTREHLDILNILQVRSGLIVLTKTDLVETDWLELVQEDIRELVRGTLLETAEIHPVSSATGAGIDRLREAIRATFASLPPRRDRGVFWLPVDRSFSMKGFGTIITGSVLSGNLQTGDSVDILPGGMRARVRGIQRHGKATPAVATGDRAAINLQGVSREQVRRGDVLATPGYFKATRRLHGKITLLKSAPELRANTRVRLHLGTTEVMARIKPIGTARIEPGRTGYAQLNLEAPAAARRLDPFVLRRYSPTHTIGGGLVLDANAPPYRKKDHELADRLRSLEKEDPAELIAGQFLAAPNFTLSADDLVSRTGLALKTVQEVIAAMQAVGVLIAVSKKSFIHRVRFEEIQRRIAAVLEAFHRESPALPGLVKAELPAKIPGRPAPAFLQFVLGVMRDAGVIREADGRIALADHEIALDPALEAAREKAEALLRAQGYAPAAPPELAEALGLSSQEMETVLGVLLAAGRLVRFDGDIFMHTEHVEAAAERLIAFLKKHGQITVPQFKELLDGASRKYAMPLLNYFDAQEITLREGDVRLPGAKAT